MIPTLVAGLVAVATAQANPMTESLPRTTGTVALSGLTADVTVERDARGLPLITGTSLDDVVRAQGFVHAQERYFQMDAARRLSAGRLAAAIGPMAASFDRRYRRYRFQHVADQAFDRLPDMQQRMLELYAEGVNAGLADLAAPPPEYVFLNIEPESWVPRDTILVVLSMFDALNFNARQERPLGVMQETLPAEMVAFLTPLQTRFDVLLVEATQPALELPPPIPGPEVVDLRVAAATAPAPVDMPTVMPGSNSWVVAGSRTTHGHAIVANDPHLQITVPTVWYRNELAWGDRHIGGVSLPGAPGIVIGSNRAVAWGLTNVGGDFQDLVVVDVDPDDPGRYRTPDGFEPFGTVEETIVVRGADDETLTLRTTRWGTVTSTDWRGRPLVMRWSALDPDTINMGLLELMLAADIEQAVDKARKWYGPAQNVMLADTNGRVGWVVSGWFPQRRGFDGAVPMAWSDGDVGWAGPMDESARPVVLDPPDGILFTANNRTVPAPWARVLGNTWDLGFRAGRIRELLLEKPKLDEADMLRIQLDTRVELFDFYRDLAATIPPGARGGPVLRSALDAIASWDGTADADETGLTMLDLWRSSLHRTIAGAITAPCREADPRFRYFWMRSEEPMRRLLEERPAHLLPRGYASWDDLIASTLVEVAGALRVRDAEVAPGLPWGERNRSEIRHPFAEFAPSFARALSMPELPQAGHWYAVRVAAPSFGASMRMVVSPGREGDGLLHAPAGQSGHPFSPHFRDGHDDWASGRPNALLPGDAVETLTLVP